MNNTLIQGHVAEWDDEMKTATANATTTTTTTATASSNVYRSITELAPPLTPPQVSQLINREAYFVHVFKNYRSNYYEPTNIPYVLPFVYMNLICNDCGKKFMNKSGQTFLSHKCSIENQEIRSNIGEENTVFIDKYKSLCVRIGKKQKQCSCVCGELKSFKDMHSHHENCDYLSRQYNNQQKTEVQISSSIAPTICHYDSTAMHPVNTFVTDLQKIENLPIITIKKNRKYILYKPFQDQFKMYIPMCAIIDKTVKKSIFDFHNLITLNWDHIKNIIDPLPSNNNNDDNSGATKIQSQRYMLNLNFDYDNLETKCMKQIKDELNIDICEIMKPILEHVKEITIATLGTDFTNGTLDTPAIIMCDTSLPQAPHIDLYGDRKQFGFMLTPDSKTTSVYMPSTENKIDTPTKLIQLMEEGIKEINMNFLLPDKNLKQIIIDLKREQIPDNIQLSFGNIFDDLQNGFGDLFKICNKKYQQSNKNGSSFNYVTKYLTHAPAGTFYEIGGGVVHAGNGVLSNQYIRIMLFWTWHRVGLEPYNVDKQETKLSVMFNIVGTIFELIKGNKANANNEDNIFGAIKLMYYCYITSDDLFQITAAEHFRNTPYIAKIIESFYGETMDEETFETKIKHLAKNNLFDPLQYDDDHEDDDDNEDDGVNDSDSDYTDMEH